MLAASLRLAHLIEREEFAAAESELPGLIGRGEGVAESVHDLLGYVAGAFRAEEASDSELSSLLRALLSAALATQSPSALLPLVIHSRSSALTLILLQSIQQEWSNMSDQWKEYIRLTFLMEIEDELLKELMEEEVDEDSQSSSPIDNRLQLLVNFADSLHSPYKMMRLVERRQQTSGSAAWLEERVARVLPLSPQAVSVSCHAHVYSPRFAFCELSRDLARLLEGGSGKRNVPLLLRCLPFLQSLAAEGATDREDAPVLQRFLSALLPWLADFSLPSRTVFLRCFIAVLDSASPELQPLLLKKFIHDIRDSVLKVDGDAQVLSFLLDLYRQRLSVRGQLQSGFVKTLGEVWAVLYKMKFDDPSECSSFYQSIFLLAHFQAGLRLRPGLLVWAKKEVLQPLCGQITDYNELRRLENEARQSSGATSGTAGLFCPRLPFDQLSNSLLLLSQTTKNTMTAIDSFLKDVDWSLE